MDSSSTYQDSIFTFDGHGRGLTRHLPVEDTNASTSWTYSADDTVATLTDPRGAVTTFKYGNVDDGTSSEYRALLTKISYSVPQGSTIPVPGNVNFVYDAAANRTSMTDDSGSLVYSYDELSRLKTETKDFADTLANAPNGVYVLSYNYHLTGGIKSIEEPFGAEVTYSTDKTSRTTAIGGSGFYDDFEQEEITSYATDITYRAFGGVKSMKYATDDVTNITVSYDTKLKPTSYEAESSANTNDIHNRTYTYNSDGSVKQVADAVESNFGQSNDYDFAGRLKRNEFAGSGANQPYKQTLGYDAFSNITSRSTKAWDFADRNYTTTFTNHRKTSGGFNGGVDTYDAAGNIVSNIAGANDVRHWKFDAAGRMVDWDETGPYISTLWDEGAILTFDGDGRTAKRLNRSRNRAGGNTLWVEEPEYTIFSSLTGQRITVLTQTGQKLNTYVYMGGSVIGEQTFGTNNNSALAFKHADPVTGAVRQTDPNGEIAPPGVGRVDSEALGAIIPPPDGEETYMPDYRKGGSVKNPESGCQLNYAPIACRVLRDIMGARGALGPGEMIVADTYLVVKAWGRVPDTLNRWRYLGILGMEHLRTDFIRLPHLNDENPIDAVKNAITEAGTVINKEKCKTAIEGLLRKAALQRFKDEGGDYDKLSREDKSEVDKSIAASFNAKGLLEAVNSALKVYKPDDFNLNNNDGHAKATTNRPGGKLTITFYAGFFGVINSGKTGIVLNDDKPRAYIQDNTSLQERASTIIHEGIHAIDPRFSDGFIGRLIKNKDKDLSLEEGSKAINEFIKENCK